MAYDEESQYSPEEDEKAQFLPFHTHSPSSPKWLQSSPSSLFRSLKFPLIALALLAVISWAALLAPSSSSSSTLRPPIPIDLTNPRASALENLNRDYDAEKEGFGVGDAKLDNYKRVLMGVADDLDLARDAANANSSYAQLRCHLSLSCSSLLPIPSRLFLTDRITSPEPPLITLWRTLNPLTTLDFLSDPQVEAFVSTYYPSKIVKQVWQNLPLSILKYDLFRLLAVYEKGGYYADTDTEPLKPLSEWGKDAVDPTPARLVLANTQPSLVVGIEWSGRRETNALDPLYSREVGVVQWTFGAAPGHPVILDAARNVLRNSLKVMGRECGELCDEDVEAMVDWAQVEGEGLHFDPEADRMVLEWSGPAVLSDSVARYLRTRWGVPLSSVARSPHPIRIGDVLILPISSLQARTSTFLKLLDWALGRNLDPWSKKEDLMIHHHKASWWNQKIKDSA